LQKCRRINRRRLISQRRLTRQQVVGDADPLLDCARRQMEDELRAERENATHSAGASLRRAQQFAEAGLKIATDIAGSWLLICSGRFISERGV
jgi:hypothetical protein